MQCLDRYLSQYLPTEVEDIKPDTSVLVHLRAAAPRRGPAADGRQEHLAALQDVRSPDRLPDAEAARPSARSVDGGLRAAPRSRAGPRPARPYTHRDDPALRADSAGAHDLLGRVGPRPH